MVWAGWDAARSPIWRTSMVAGPGPTAAKSDAATVAVASPARISIDPPLPSIDTRYCSLDSPSGASTGASEPLLRCVCTQPKCGPTGHKRPHVRRRALAPEPPSHVRSLLLSIRAQGGGCAASAALCRELRNRPAGRRQANPTDVTRFTRVTASTNAKASAPAAVLSASRSAPSLPTPSRPRDRATARGPHSRRRRSSRKARPPASGTRPQRTPSPSRT